MASLAELIEGFDYVETISELERRLALARPLRVKLGFDPTSADLHFGHTVILNRLQRFVEAGHQAVLVIGDFTARIGDPSGRNELRPPLDEAKIAENMATYTKQAGRILDLERVEVRYNSEWLAPLTLDGLITLMSGVTVAQMLKREDFAKRHDNGVPIALHEFLYPIAQAYDSVALRSDIELGGNDQLFNVLMGRHYQTTAGQAPQICMTTPILEGIDGIKKMSKSLSNAIGVQEAPHDQFGKTMRIPDELIARWSHLLLDIPESLTQRLNDAITSGTVNPMTEKKRLAHALVTKFHSAQSADDAQEHFERTIQRHEVPVDMPTVQIPSHSRMVDILVMVEFAQSKRAAERLIVGEGVRLDGQIVSNAKAEFDATEAVLSVGSRKFVRLRLAGIA